MSEEKQVNVQEKNTEERNFAAMREALEAERRARKEAEERAARLEASQKATVQSDDTDYGDPYVDDRKLDKKLSSFESKMDQKIERMAEEKARKMIELERQQAWIKQNADFYDVMQHAQKLAEKDPELAETILAMPDTFERQKLVYKSIKAQGVHKPAEAKPSIQDQINNNKKAVYYQPTDKGMAPYSAQGDFSPQGQKAAYEKLLQLKSGLRLGG